jgi:hypothetical protein
MGKRVSWQLEFDFSDLQCVYLILSLFGKLRIRIPGEKRFSCILILMRAAL